MRGSFQGSGGNRGRLGALCSALTFAALAIPAAASGDPIYVAPDDQSSGFFCSESQPCALVVGINLVADDGDEVLLAPDIYETSDELEVPATAQNVTIHSGHFAARIATPSPEPASTRPSRASTSPTT